jgi:hypothetical protein
MGLYNAFVPLAMLGAVMSFDSLHACFSLHHHHFVSFHFQYPIRVLRVHALKTCPLGKWGQGRAIQMEGIVIHNIRL